MQGFHVILLKSNHTTDIPAKKEVSYFEITASFITNNYGASEYRWIRTYPAIWFLLNEVICNFFKNENHKTSGYYENKYLS